MQSICLSRVNNSNRGILYTLCLFLFIICRVNGSSPKDTIIYTNIPSIDPLNRVSLSKTQFAFITSTSWDMHHRELIINVVERKQNQFETISVSIPTSLKILQCPTICLNDSFLLIQDEYDLNWFLFKYVVGKYKLVEKIKLPSHSTLFDARVLNEHCFLLTDIYNHHPADSVSNTTLCVYDARARKVTKVIHPELPCIGLSHLQQNWISQSDQFVVLAEPCGNKIRLYDQELNQVRTIQIPQGENWKNLPGNKLPFETSPLKIDPKSLIANLSPLLQTFSRIITIHLANDSLLLINCSFPDTMQGKTENFVYNINRNKFENDSQVKITLPRSLEDNDSRTFEITPYQMIRDGFCYSLEEDNFLYNNQLTTRENEKLKNEFYENHDPEFIIRISKIEIH